MSEHKPDPEFVEYMRNQVKNPFLSANVVMQMERVFIDQRSFYEARLATARACERTWEKTMMQVIGEDGPASVADAIRKLQDQASSVTPDINVAEITRWAAAMIRQEGTEAQPSEWALHVAYAVTGLDEKQSNTIPKCDGNHSGPPCRDRECWNDEGQAPGEWRDEKLAEAMHYPGCWDTAAYPDLASAVWEVCTGMRCSTCAENEEAARAQKAGSGEAVAVGEGERVGATIYLGLQQSVAVVWADEKVLNEIEQTDLDEVFSRITEGKPCGRYSVVFREETEYPDSDCIGSPCLVPVASRAVAVNAHPSASVPEAIKHQARRVRNYSNPNEVFEAIPLSAFGPESTTTPQPAPGPLPYWKPCNPACDPELNGYRDRGCSCEPARIALSNTAPPAEGAE